jgi:DNA polymerase-3 subunit beta
VTTTEDLELDTTEVEEEEIPFVPSQANMGFTTKKFVLQALLEKAAAVLPTRDIMPVLKNFQILVADGKITVIATDLELSVMAEGEMVSVRTAGEAVFPGKDLISIVREAADGDLVLDVVDGDCTIRVGKATWFLKLMDGTDYPALPDLAEVEFHDVDRAKFLAALNTVRYAAASATHSSPTSSPRSSLTSRRPY